MKASVKAAAVQMSPVLYCRTGTVEKVVKRNRDLGDRGVQFATFSETVIPYYPYFCFLQPPPELLSLPIDRTLAPHVHERSAYAKADPSRVERVAEKILETL